MKDWPAHQMLAGFSWPSAGSRHSGGSTRVCWPVAGSQSHACAVFGDAGPSPPCRTFGFFGYENHMTLPVGRTAACTAITGIGNGAAQRPTSAGSPTAAACTRGEPLVGQLASTGRPSQQGVLARVGRAEHRRLERAQLSLAHPGNAEAAAVSVRRRSLRPYEALADRGLHARIPARRPPALATTQREQGQWQAGQNEERTGRQELAKE